MLIMSFMFLFIKINIFNDISGLSKIDSQVKHSISYIEEFKLQWFLCFAHFQIVTREFSFQSSSNSSDQQKHQIRWLVINFIYP